VTVVQVWPDDPWGQDLPLRDVASIPVRLAGVVAKDGEEGIPFRLVFPDDARAERAANAYLADLSHTFARPLTLRSYAFDILRWLRFLVGVGVVFDEATRGDYTDYRRWLIDHGKTGGVRRPRAEPPRGRLNRVTGKVMPDEVQFDPATIRHSRVVLHEWYEFLAERGCRPLVNPIPHSRRQAAGEPRAFAHHNPLEPFAAGRARRVDPPDPQMTPRHLTDAHFCDFWAELSSDRNRALVKITVDCGIRPGELLALRGEDIDWGNAALHVVRKGGRKAQWLPVSGDAVVWLRRYQADSGYVAGMDEPVWIVARGRRRPLDYDAYRAVFNRVNAKLGTNWTPHDLRHTACVRMLDAGMDVAKVQQMMGHEDLKTTQRYVRPRLEELIEAQREAQARPQAAAAFANPYSQSDLDDLFGRSR
jgi:integrase/recombinase XerD